MIKNSIFVSYASDDHVSQFIEDLDSYLGPIVSSRTRKRLFWDRACLTAGDELSNLAQEIHHSAAWIIVLSRPYIDGTDYSLSELSFILDTINWRKEKSETPPFGRLIVITMQFDLSFWRRAVGFHDDVVSIDATYYGSRGGNARKKGTHWKDALFNLLGPLEREVIQIDQRTEFFENRNNLALCSRIDEKVVQLHGKFESALLDAHSTLPSRGRA